MSISAAPETPDTPRIDGRTVDVPALERQESEIEQFDYSWSHYWPSARRDDAGRTRHPDQLPCLITFLGGAGKEIIETHIGESAMYGGAIASRGPRYCPSVEDKIVKFPAAERHQLFLEPEGHDTHELYVNGLSTSLPAEVQLSVLHSIPGLERARMTAAPIAAGSGIAIEESPLLQERNFGDLRGLPYAALNEDPFGPSFAPPNGEDWPAFHARVAEEATRTPAVG